MKKVETSEEAILIALQVFMSEMTEEQLARVEKKLEALNIKTKELIDNA